MTAVVEDNTRAGNNHGSTSCSYVHQKREVLDDIIFGAESMVLDAAEPPA